MRFALGFLCVISVFAMTAVGEEATPVVQATHVQGVPETQALDRIRKIVLNQGDDSRALANLVQLSRDLPGATASQLYFDLAHDYLRGAKYNQAASVLQQLMNQHPNQPITAEATLTLSQLYTSSEVHHTQPRKSTSTVEHALQSFSKYAQYTTNSAVQQNAELNNHTALTFQRAVAARHSGSSKAALGRLTKLKHAAEAEPWRSRARAEQWLATNREDEPPLPIVACRSAAERPHLDGVLDESLWQADHPVQLAHDEEFLYLAVTYPKVEGLSYQPDPRPRTHDADLSAFDHVRLRLDADRDYATCYEFAVDSRGWTAERCWHDKRWNPQWFVAANTTDTHWSLEAAIPQTHLTASPLQRSGATWAIAWQRIVPGYEVEQSSADDFQLLIFE